MNRRAVERRLRRVNADLGRAREELAIAEEQLLSLNDDADDARVRALVSETPLAEREWQQANRHAQALTRSRDVARQRIAELEKTEAELLEQLVGLP